jgi:S1-C subfamily serine protease
MTDHEAPALSWVCPACGRRVPSKVSTCRCGYETQGAPETPAPDTPVAIPEPPAPSHTAKTALTAAVAVAATVGVFYWANPGKTPVPPRKPDVKSAASTTPAIVAGPPGAGAATPTPVAAEGDVARSPAPMAVPAATPESAEQIATNSGAPSLEDVISHAMPALVRVETGSGFGSGFFITPDTILTNVHVVGGNPSVTIRRRDGTTFSARVETTAPELDVAVIRVSNPDPNQPTLPLGSGVHARAGQEVLAIGTPLGLQNTVTRGIVSAVREVGGLTLVQTDAAINPGNSGGPLLDRSGHVIGITTLGVKSSEAQGLSFAVAIEHAQGLLAGKRSTEQKGTPLSTLNEAMSGRKAPSEAPSDADGTRVRSAKTYEELIATLARRADALDDRWRSFKRSCYGGRVAGAFDREWFAFWDPRAMQGAVSPGCESAFSDIRRAADDIRDAVLSAGEAARQADVYPGTRRDTLRRYHLDYAGWDK